MTKTNADGNVFVKDFIAKFEDDLPPTWQKEATLEVIQVWKHRQASTVTDN
jgi:hypothetical protein